MNQNQTKLSKKTNKNKAIKKSSAVTTSSSTKNEESLQVEPIIFKNKEGQIIAGIFVESSCIVNTEIEIRGWSIGESEIALICSQDVTNSVVSRHNRFDVVETYHIAESNNGFGFILAVKKVPTDCDCSLQWSVTLDGQAQVFNFPLSLNVKENNECEAIVDNSDTSIHLLGNIDRIVDMTIIGWARNLIEPEKNVTVEFTLDGHVIGSTICDIPRRDLLDSGIGNGSYGFSWKIPSYVDLQQISAIQVQIQDSTLLLTGTVIPIFTSLKTTGIYDGKIEFSWPYLIRGNLISLTDDVVDTVEVVCADITLLRLTLVEDIDTHSETFGMYKFSEYFPIDRLTHSSPPMYLKLPHNVLIELCSFIPVIEESEIIDSKFHITGDIVNGWILMSPDVEAQSVKLRMIIIGLTQSHSLVLEAAGRNQKLYFSFSIGADFFTGEDYQIGICTDTGNYPLRSATGEYLVAYRKRVIGNVDSYILPRFRGWVVDLYESDQSKTVQLFDGANLISQATTLITRLDVNKKLGINGSHGFEITVPADVFDGKQHDLVIKCEGFQLKEGATLKKPLTYLSTDLLTVDPQLRISGRVEQLTVDLIAGWAFDLMRPEVPVELVIKVDGQILGTTQANRFSARLRAVSGSGHQQFLFQLPDHLQNGSKREITVHEVTTGFALKNNLSPISFPLVKLPEPMIVQSGWNYGGHSTATFSKLRVFSPVKTTKPKKKLPLVSMIALNWNGDLMLEDFFESLLRITFINPIELLLVDHGSNDCSLEIVSRYQSRLPIKLIERRANYSFSASNNYAASLASGSLLLFLNNDLIFQHDCVSRLTDFFDDVSVGVVGGRLLEPIKEANGSWAFEPHHEGVRFKVAILPNQGRKYYSPHEITGIPAEARRSALEMPVVTAALMMCRKTDFEAIGGFNEEYFYGLEDVDFCLKVSTQLGKKIICDLDSSAIHNRSATRDSKFVEKQLSKLYTADIHSKNRATYIRRFGRHLTRKILKSLIESSSFYGTRPLRVTFAVTEADINTAAGDYFTALELGLWLRKKFSWDIFFVKMENYSLPGTDVLIVMRHDYDIRKVTQTNPGFITVAWIRNRVDQWIERPEFNDYNLIFASSHKALSYVRENTGRKAILLPIATNPDRFSPNMVDLTFSSDLVFTGSYHGAVRGAVKLLDIEKSDYQFAIYGYNWDKYPPFAPHWRGSIRYDLLGKAYASSKLVLDDSHPVTREWNSLNSRIFDALASGKVVMTNCVEGAKELFGDKLPTFSSRAELNTLVERLLNNDEEREKLAVELRQEVLTNHTYANRADTLKSALLEFVEKTLRFAIKIGVPKIEECEQWGDYHFALGIKRALEKQGHFARIDILPDWDGGLTSSDDVVIVLRGLSKYKPQPTTINLMWLISHPDEVTIAEMREYDHVFIASESYVGRIRGQLGSNVSPLLQCTDPGIFYPDVDGTLDIAEVLFVGNSRGQRRDAVQHALDAGIDFGVYGSGWQGILPAERVMGEYIPNNELRRYYSATKVLLNDHWLDMRSEGFISNRIFDAGACGATIVTDDIEAGHQLFGDMLSYYRNAQEFEQCIHSALTKETEKATTESISRFILENHTFDHRIAEILCTVADLQNN